MRVKRVKDRSLWVFERSGLDGLSRVYMGKTTVVPFFRGS